MMTKQRRFDIVCPATFLAPIVMSKISVKLFVPIVVLEV